MYNILVRMYTMYTLMYIYIYVLILFYKLKAPQMVGVSYLVGPTVPAFMPSKRTMIHCSR